MPDVIRAFVALELPAEMRARLAAAAEALRPALPGVRWVGDQGYHLTLRFLGWSRPEQVAALETPLLAAAAACPAGEIRVEGLGAFPERGSPRVLWAGIALPASIRGLQTACERFAVEAGFAAEPRAFRPHLTLGRWKDRASRPDLASFDLGSCRVDRLVLFQSRLQHSAAVYTPLRAFPLG